ncbi:MAG: hypothetical protein WC662_04945 [Candidatus Paceibacterota bacterium]|jgi:hypothetical protein
MIGKKLVLLKKGQLTIRENFPIEIPNIQEVKYIIIKNTKKHSYIILVETIRFSIRSSKYFKEKYTIIKDRVKEIYRKNVIKNKKEEIKKEKKEVSGFLKMISEYKHKIKTIKHRIKEEEKLK